MHTWVSRFWGKRADLPPVDAKNMVFCDLCARGPGYAKYIYLEHPAGKGDIKK